MITRNHAYHYNRNFKVALIISLCIVIGILYLFPNISNIRSVQSSAGDYIFKLSDVPPTIQSSARESVIFQKPPIPKIYIPSDISDPQILNDAEIVSSSSQKGTEGSRTSKTGSSAVLTASQLPFIPRQILEVLPQKSENKYSGNIKLYLKIDKKGQVASYMILSNTTSNSECLQNVLKAAYKSKWEPAIVNGNKVEYWIEKSYSFK